MTTFASPTPTLPDIDDLVKQNRARTPKVATEARKVPRSSIAELNDLDIDEIRDRYVASGYDNRSPVVKVLDLFDLSRNTVANVLFGATGVVNTKGLRKGTLGLPVINTSDALETLGVKNRLVRGIVGFVGDVALDPLTYVGPAGWGLQAMDNAGRAVRIGRGGAKGLKTGLKEVSRGTPISHAPTRELYETMLQNAPEAIRMGDGAAKAAYLSERAMGKVGAASKAGTPFYYLSRGIGGDAKSRGGMIAEGLTKEGAEGDAVRSFVSRAGSAAGPGLGSGGSQVAHIPFTDYSVKVPGFTRAGKGAEEDLAFARSAAPRAVGEIATPTMIRAGQLAREIADASEGGIDAAPQMQELAELVGRNTADPIAPQNPREVFALQKLADEAQAGMDAARARMGTHNQSLTGLEDPDTLFDSLDDATGAPLADSAQAAFKAYQRYKGAVTGGVRNFAQNSPQEEMLTRAAMRFLGTDDRIVGRAAFAGPEAMLRTVRAPEAANVAHNRLYNLKATIFGEKGTKLASEERAFKHAIGPTQRRAVQTYLGETSGALRKAFEDSGVTPNGDDLDEAATLLMAIVTKQQAERGAAQVGDGVYYTKAFGSEELSPFLKHLESAKKSGKMSPTLNNGLYQRLEAVAEKYGADLLEELENIEVGAGVLGKARAGYVPNTMTPAAGKAAKAASRYQDQPARAKLAKSATESFQKPRSFDQVRWVGADGAEKRMFRAEMDQAQRFATNPQELVALQQEGYGDVAAEMQKLVDDWTEFQALPEPPSFRNTDPFEMNELAKQGRFSMMLDGVDPVGGFMQTNMLAAMANRIGGHERAMARKTWGEYVNQFGLKVPEFRGASVGNKIIAADGSEAKIISTFDANGRPVKGAMIGGQVYRPVQGLKPDNPITQMLGPESAQTVYNDRVAAAIERTAAVFDEPNVILDTVNKMTQQWKNLTLLHPSWTIFNMIGDTSNAIGVGRANVKHLVNPKFAKFAFDTQRYAANPEKLRNLTITLRGVPVTGEQIMSDLVSRGVIDGTMMEDMAIKMVENRIFTMPSQAQGLGNAGRFRPAVLHSDFKDAAQRFALARAHDTPSVRDKMSAGKAIAGDRYLNNFLGPWFRMNQRASNHLRTLLYMGYLEDGYDAASAAQAVIRSQLDYSNSTKVESEYFRTLFPFFSWIRGNGALQLKALMERPAYAGVFTKLQTAIEEAIAGDERVPMNLRPRWMHDALALQIGSDPEKRSAVLAGGALPAADLFQYLTPLMGTEGAMDFLHYFGSGLNPALNIPLQLASGHETFSGRTIGSDPLSGDVSAGEFLKNQIRPLAEWGPGGKAWRAFDKGAGAGIGRTLLGGRVQDFSQERLTSTRLREFKDTERRIRQAITRAERMGEKEKSLRARVKLMELYQHGMENGLEEAVPRWARPQLEQLQQPQS